METHFQQELNQLKSELLRMAGLAERAISNAVEALVKRDTPLAKKTVQEDAQINEMEINIEGSEGWVSFYRADLLP
jgi:phosphate transport system protein